MTKKIQLGFLLAAAMSCSLFDRGASAQHARADRPPQRQAAPAPRPGVNRPPAENPNMSRPSTRQMQAPPSRNFQRNEIRPAPAIPAGRSNSFNDRPNGGARLTPPQPSRAGSSRPFVDRMREMTPQQRDRQLQSSRAFQNFSPEQQNRIRQQFNQWDKMSPQQRANLREKENTWRNLTPEQRDHIKNDVLPKWRQVPWERQQVIQQKLGVLQNMPESARNQRLSDPNFTRGMSEDDRAMLHDLSHLHVGGAPDPPGNEP